LSYYFALVPAFFPLIGMAQPKIIVRIDTAYAHSGKVEFPLSQFGDEITDFYGIFPDVKDVSNVTVCGKVGTANPIQKSLVSSN